MGFEFNPATGSWDYQAQDWLGLPYTGLTSPTSVDDSLRQKQMDNLQQQAKAADNYSASATATAIAGGLSSPSITPYQPHAYGGAADLAGQTPEQYAAAHGIDIESGKNSSNAILPLPLGAKQLQGLVQNVIPNVDAVNQGPTIGSRITGNALNDIGVPQPIVRAAQTAADVAPFAAIGGGGLAAKARFTALSGAGGEAYSQTGLPDLPYVGNPGVLVAPTALELGIGGISAIRNNAVRAGSEEFRPFSNDEIKTRLQEATNLAYRQERRADAIGSDHGYNSPEYLKEAELLSHLEDNADKLGVEFSRRMPGADMWAKGPMSSIVSGKQNPGNPELGNAISDARIAERAAQARENLLAQGYTPAEIDAMPGAQTPGPGRDVAGEQYQQQVRGGGEPLAAAAAEVERLQAALTPFQTEATAMSGGKVAVLRGDLTATEERQANRLLDQLDRARERLNGANEVDALRQQFAHLPKMGTAETPPPSAGAGVVGPPATNAFKRTYTELPPENMELPGGAPRTNPPIDSASDSPLPSWLQTNIDQAHARAQQLGLVGDISDLAAQRLTARQIAEQIKGRVGGNVSEAENLVRAVRIKEGIPSMTTGAGAAQSPNPEFEAWLQSRGGAPRPESGGTGQPNIDVTPVGPKGADFVQEKLNYAGNGSPGLTQNGNELTYRDPSGKPIAYLEMVNTNNGPVIETLVADPNAGLLKGRAVSELIKAAQESGVSGVGGTVTPEAQRLLEHATGGAGQPPSEPPPAPPAAGAAEPESISNRVNTESAAELARDAELRAQSRTNLGMDQQQTPPGQLGRDYEIGPNGEIKRSNSVDELTKALLGNLGNDEKLPPPSKSPTLNGEGGSAGGKGRGTDGKGNGGPKYEYDPNRAAKLVVNELTGIVRATIPFQTLGPHELRIGAGLELSHPSVIPAAEKAALQGWFAPDKLAANLEKLNENKYIGGDGQVGFRWNDYDPAARTAEKVLNNPAASNRDYQAAIRQLGEQPVIGTRAKLAEQLRSLTDDQRLTAAQDSALNQGSRTQPLPRPFVSQLEQTLTGGERGIFARSQNSLGGRLETMKKAVFENQAELEAKMGMSSPDHALKDYQAIQHAGGTAFSGGRTPDAASLALYAQAVLARFATVGDLFFGWGSPLGVGSRNIALKALIADGALDAAVLGISALGGAAIMTPWNAPLTNTFGVNTKIGKAVSGATSVDASTGYLTIVRLMANIANDIQNGGTDKDGNPVSPQDAIKTHLAAFGRGELGPIPSKLLDIALGKDYKGDPYTWQDIGSKKELQDSLLPFAANGIYKAATTPGGNVPLSLWGLGAVSVTTKDPSQSFMKRLDQSGLDATTLYNIQDKLGNYFNIGNHASQNGKDLDKGRAAQAAYLQQNPELIPLLKAGHYSIPFGTSNKSTPYLPQSNFNATPYQPSGNFNPTPYQPSPPKPAPTFTPRNKQRVPAGAQ